MGANDLHKVADLDPCGMIGRVHLLFYVGNTKHCNILNILAEGLMALEKMILKFFPMISLWELKTTGV